MTTTVTEPPRRQLSARQAELVERLIEAAALEATERGYDGMTVRSAARRAGLAAATAYTYFGSKDHLLAEVLWRRLDRLAPFEGDSPATGTIERVTEELTRLATFMASEPELASAATTALLGSGAEVRVLRDRFGNRIMTRISRALGESRTKDGVLQTLNLALMGAMLSAGMGHLDFDQVPDAMRKAASLVLEQQQTSPKQSAP